MDIQKTIEEIIAEKAQATNKDKMGLLVDKALDALQFVIAQPLDEPSEAIVAALKESFKQYKSEAEHTIVELKADHVKQLESAKEQFTVTLNKLEADYKEMFAEQDQQHEDLRTQLAEAQVIAQEALAQFNETAPKVPQVLETTSASGVKVKVNFGVHYNGNQYTAAALVEEPAVIDELIAIGSGSITILED
jgi:hypothetical protein